MIIKPKVIVKVPNTDNEIKATIEYALIKLVKFFFFISGFAICFSWLRFTNLWLAVGKNCK